MKVLFIDDDPMILRMSGFILKKGGYEALAAGSGDEGIALIVEQSPDLVFIDVEMPEKNGFETLEEIRQSGIDVRVCMMSGSVSSEIRDKTVALGAEGLIEKPLNAADVYSVIKG